jgi:hypothetical protein
MAKSPQKSADVARFLRIVEAYEKKYENEWHKRATKVIDRFSDERKEIENTRSRFNLLWSNVETLKPFLYSNTPKPIVQPRVDEDDEIAAMACQVLERALTFFVAEEHFGSTLRYARDDYLLPGRGSAWVRYVPHMKPAQVEDVSETPADEEDGAETQEPQEIVAFEEVIPDFVLWRDFGHTVARTWEEVDCVWRRVKMSRKALVKRFGDVGEKVSLDCSATTDGKVKEPDEDNDRAEVYELWCKSEKRAVWFTKSYPELLDDQEDPLRLPHFFPCPRPVYATLRTDSLVPIPDYIEYQDQARELDDLTARINALTDAVKAAGVYDKNVPGLQRLLDDGHDNTLVPVDSWAALAEKGGLKGVIELLPMQEIAETLMILYKARDAVKADCYEITGMSDIIRGNTAPEETATAQQIKSNFATKRLAERQAEVERFARNLIDIMGQVIAGLFSFETLAKITGVKLIPDQATKQQLQQLQQAPQPNAPPIPKDAMEAMTKPTWEEVMQLLRDEPSRRFRIDIETDSMVAADDAQEQQARTQFLEMAGQFLNQAMQAGAAHPEMAPLLGRMLMFGVQGFRVGRDLDDAFKQFIEDMEKRAQQAQQQGPQPSPDIMKIQGELKLKQQSQQFDQQLRQQQYKSDCARADADQQHRHQMDVASAQTDAARNDHSAMFDSMQARFDAHMQQQQAMVTASLEKFKALLTAKTQIEVAEINAQSKLDAAQVSAANQATEDE